MATLGTNIDVKTVGDKLVLTIDTSKEFGPSASGKTIRIATSAGNKPVGDVFVGLNVYRYADGGKKKADKKAKK